MGRLDELIKLKNDIETKYENKRNKLSNMFIELFNELKLKEQQIYRNYTKDITSILYAIANESKNTDLPIKSPIKNDPPNTPHKKNESDINTDNDSESINQITTSININTTDINDINNNEVSNVDHSSDKNIIKNKDVPLIDLTNENEYDMKNNLNNNTNYYKQNNISLTRIPKYEFKCDKCSKYFATNKDLKEHITIHSGIKQFKCFRCNKSFLSKQSLYMHRQSVHY